MSSEELASLCESIAARERHVRDFYRHVAGDGGWKEVLSSDAEIVPAIEENYATIFSQLKAKYGESENNNNNNNNNDRLLAELARHMALTAVSEDRARRLHGQDLERFARLVEYRKNVATLGAPPLDGHAEPLDDLYYARALQEQSAAIEAHLREELRPVATEEELSSMAKAIARHRTQAAYIKARGGA